MVGVTSLSGGVVALFILLGGSLLGCNGEDRVRLKRAVSWEERLSDAPLPSERIDQLQEAVSFYEEELDRKVKAGMELGIYHRTLGLEYFGLEMYQLALDSFREALFYYPEDPDIAYHLGVASARLSRGVLESEEREEHLKLAEAYYRRALDIDGDHTNSAYALSILYHFEVGRSAEAIPLLEDILEGNKGEYRARLLLGRVYASLGDIDRAIAAYESVVEGSGESAEREVAMRNRDTLMEGR